MKRRLESLIALTLFPTLLLAQPAPPSATGGNAATTMDALSMLANLSKSYPALTFMVTGLCYVIGMSLMIRAIYYLKVYGELRTMMSTQSSLKIPMTYMVAGAVFLFIPTAFQTMTMTVFGTSSMLGYENIDSSINPIVLRAVGGFVQLLGFVSFIRGWMILVANATSPGGGGASFGKGLTHIIGGLLLVNIYGVASVVWNTFGLSF